jgi:predicted nucleic acid-binding protein
LIVVDASVVAEWLLRLPKARAIEARLFAPGETLHAPHLLDVEVTQVVRRYAATGVIDQFTGRRAIGDLADLPMRRYPHDWLLPRIWALRNNVTAYDATYVALSEALEATLITKDRRLATAAFGFVSIETV